MKSQSSNSQVNSFTPSHNFALYKECARVPFTELKKHHSMLHPFPELQKRNSGYFFLLLQSHQCRISQIRKHFQTSQNWIQFWHWGINNCHQLQIPWATSCRIHSFTHEFTHEFTHSGKMLINSKSDFRSKRISWFHTLLLFIFNEDGFSTPHNFLSQAIKVSLDKK